MTVDTVKVQIMFSWVTLNLLHKAQLNRFDGRALWETGILEGLAIAALGVAVILSQIFLLMSRILS